MLLSNYKNRTAFERESGLLESFCRKVMEWRSLRAGCMS